ncbi:aminotransferase class V-fold PLP-dependent enzyme [Altererythrobacter sp. CC-YST694]|uniref:cysteine desulfurase family protein n=1 Tax=Altererythrobacter sp. CC-YST694 TaxID=2755038 RepID=UPI001D02EEC7|nr:aminotransferase class V-fold PLP-dependent enzyme [Altererythrobacter sp. CC-YST694]MCB5424870.1 aminotransferase class V-fold PLP-dependent enzyme [Altererythrobacter sp. CC-YST694]
MMTDRIYLDFAATTPLLPEAGEAMRQGFAIWANPSSPHAEGRKARAALEDARARIRVSLGWEGEVVFTSGASEALAIALTRAQAPLLAVSAVEHESVLRHAGDTKRLPVDALGLVNPADCALPGLVAVQQANSETGVIQPLGAVAEAVRGAGGVLLADCAQGAGKLALPDADLIALSAHKFGGPIGIGALLVRDWALLKPTGGQERGYRGGTENLPGAMAMVAALEADRGWLDEAVRLRALLDEAIAEAGGELLCEETARVPSIAAYRMPGMSANAQLIRFDAAGFAVSAGSACSSGSLKVSHVLSAMDYADPGEVIRVSIGRETSEADVRAFIDQWRAVAGGR